MALGKPSTLPLLAALLTSAVCRGLCAKSVPQNHKIQTFTPFLDNLASIVHGKLGKPYSFNVAYGFKMEADRRMGAKKGVGCVYMKSHVFIERGFRNRESLQRGRA